jgi:hypothetical protein
VSTTERDLEIERLRESHRPPAIKTLFVGESRPANGKFFYEPEPRPIARWFEKALELGGDDFLVRFRDSGLYLDDLVLTAVNLSTNADKAPASPRGRARPSGAGYSVRPEAPSLHHERD